MMKNDEWVVIVRTPKYIDKNIIVSISDLKNPLVILVLNLTENRTGFSVFNEDLSALLA